MSNFSQTDIDLVRKDWKCCWLSDVGSQSPRNWSRSRLWVWREDGDEVWPCSYGDGVGFHWVVAICLELWLKSEEVSGILTVVLNRAVHVRFAQPKVMRLDRHFGWDEVAKFWPLKLNWSDWVLFPPLVLAITIEIHIEYVWFQLKVANEAFGISKSIRFVPKVKLEFEIEGFWEGNWGRVREREDGDSGGLEELTQPWRAHMRDKKRTSRGRARVW